MQVFVSLKGETLEQKVQCVKSVGWGMNTNLQAAFEHVLETALDHEVPSEEMPKALIVVRIWRLMPAWTRTGCFMII